MPKTVRKLLKKGVLNTSKEEEKRVKQPEKNIQKKTTPSLPVFHLQRPVVEEKEEEKKEEEMIVFFWFSDRRFIHRDLRRMLFH